MKGNKKMRSLGSCLVIAGLVCLVVFAVGMLVYGNADPADYTVNDETRQEAIRAAEEAAAQARNAAAAPLNDLISYYQSVGYQDAAAPLLDLKAKLDAGEEITEETNRAIQAIRSVDGVENEVPRISNLQRQMNAIVRNNQEAERLRKSLGTQDGVAAARRQAALAGISTTVWLLLIALALLMLAVGFYLNHGYAMRQVLSKVLLYTLLVIGGVIMIFPFYWMISSSLKTRQEVGLFPPQFVPGNWLNFENYRLASNTAPFAQYFLNSVVVCFFSVLIVTVTTILASFAFSRLQFPGRELIFSALLSMMMLPFEMLVITNYSTIIQIGLNDTLGALIVPFISSIFYTYIMRNFFMSIPDSLYWSARVDGCSNWRYLWKIMVPIARPSLVTVILLNALASWNSFMWPLLVIKSTANRTLPFGLYAFTTEGGTYQELIMAASTVTVLPMIILFLFARKQILRGVARGGLKG